MKTWLTYESVNYFKVCMPTYKIVRLFINTCDTETVATGLTLEEAEEHCQNPETSSKTATSPEGKARTENDGPWFDGFLEE